ncbi:glycosyltransferase [Lacticigenium naphthae]|uniref:glycosyltransferase n=1 Tax=Lacticigenium naphthae TaxID=515351 RepID=UPI00041F4723|nr:glycosyltransferase family 2 protein [Lacticigenium naphthae]
MNIMILLNYNDFQTTEIFLNEIKEYKILHKIIVVDNCSTDNSYDLLKKFVSEKIDVISSDSNKGYASGNNYGIKYAEKNYIPQNIIISNPDINVSEDSIRNICNHLDSHDKVAAVSGLIHDINENIVANFAWRLPRYQHMIINTSLVLSKLHTIITSDSQFYNRNELVDQSGSFDVEVLSGCFFAIKYKVMKNIDYFDERTFLYNEETILAHKIKEEGFKEVILVDEKIIHHQGLSIKKSINNWKFKSKILEESQLIYLKKYLKISKSKIRLFKICFYVGKYEKYLLTNIKQKLMEKSKE